MTKRQDPTKSQRGKGGGRPTTYKELYIKEVDKYLSQCKDEYEQVVKQFNEEKGYEMYDNKLKVNLPTIEGFSIFVDIGVSTLYEWRNSNLKFLEALERIKRIQKKMLIDNGLAFRYNSTIAKLILSANHNMVEKTKSTIEHKGLSALLDKADEEDEKELK